MMATHQPKRKEKGWVLSIHEVGGRWSCPPSFQTLVYLYICSSALILIDYLKGSFGLILKQISCSLKILCAVFSQLLAYLQGVIASRKNNDQAACAFLNEAAELHCSALHGLPLSIEYYEKLNPMFMIEIVKEYLVFCPKQVETWVLHSPFC